MQINEEVTHCRLDQWLVAARFYKTRSLAINAIKNGRILLNKVRPKPARTLQLNDILQIDKGLGAHFEVRVLKLATKRPSAKIASTFYEESAESIKRREEDKILRKTIREESPKARPSSRDRKKLREIHRGGV